MEAKLFFSWMHKLTEMFLGEKISEQYAKLAKLCEH